MEEITWFQLSIERNRGDNGHTKIIHVDNWVDNSKNIDIITYCGRTNIDLNFNFLTIQNKPKMIKICKQCSQIYRRKYDHSLESFIARLKVRDKLFIKR